MLRIRLRRTGAKKQPRYRVVVAESSAPRDGAFVEILGWYNPQADPAQVVVNTEKAARWIERGAQPSDRVAYLLKRAGLGQPVEAAPSQAPAASEPEAKPAGRKRATKAEPAETATGTSTGRKRATPKAAEPAASEVPESEGSAASVVSAATDAAATEAPESEGSAGATPA